MKHKAKVKKRKIREPDVYAYCAKWLRAADGGPGFLMAHHVYSTKRAAWESFCDAVFLDQAALRRIGGRVVRVRLVAGKR